MDLAPLYDVTPTLDSLALKKITGKTIFLKMECNQPVGSFKIRGLSRLCQYEISRGKTHFVSSSGGNAGYTVAYIGRKLKKPVTVFLPKTSKRIYLDAITAQGAKTVVSGEVWDEANAAAQEFCAQEADCAFIPPFDHPLIWAGHATMIDEVAANNIKPDAIVTAVGGGGLACGLLQGMENYGWSDVPLFCVETEGAAAFAASIKAQRLVRLDKVSTIATSLATKEITPKLMEWYRKHPMESLLVSDQQTVLAIKQFLNDQRVFVEPACGAALAVIYQMPASLKKYSSILTIVCGGIGISTDLLREYNTN